MITARNTRFFLLAVVLFFAGTLVLDHKKIRTNYLSFPQPRQALSLYGQYVEKLLKTGKEMGIKLTLFNPGVLEDWHKIGSSLVPGECLVLCGRMLIFAVEAKDLKANPSFLPRLGHLGFNTTIYETDGDQAHVSLSPRGTQHVHITVLHHKHAGYLRQYALTDPPDFLTTEATNFLGLDRAFEKIDTKPNWVEGLRVQMPRDIPAFLQHVKESQFIPCNKTRAREFYKALNKTETKTDLKFKQNAIALLSKTAKVLHHMKIRFWIASGTFLGFYRQCDIIPWSKDVDIALFVEDYKPDMAKALVANGLTFIQIFGRLNDSYELSFIANGIKLDVFFFYHDGSILWHGGIYPPTGKKFRYNFPSFTLCWGELAGIKVRVPCQANAYLTADYGLDWFYPKTSWDWMNTPHMVLNGYWDKKDWPEVNVVNIKGIIPK